MFVWKILSCGEMISFPCKNSNETIGQTFSLGEKYSFETRAESLIINANIELNKLMFTIVHT